MSSSLSVSALLVLLLLSACDRPAAPPPATDVLAAEEKAIAGCTVRNSLAGVPLLAGHLEVAGAGAGIYIANADGTGTAKKVWSGSATGVDWGPTP